MGCGLGGCARWRKVTVTVAIQLNGWLRSVGDGHSYSCSYVELLSNFQYIFKCCGIKLGWGLVGCARRRKVTITVAVKLSWGVFFKSI